MKFRQVAAGATSVLVLLTILVVGTPSRAEALAGTAAIDVGPIHGCAVEAGGEMYCWGDNFRGKLGDGTTTNRNIPTRVSTDELFTKVATGYSHTCGITTSGKAYCWGDNWLGMVGDGTYSTRLVPTLVSDVLTFSDITASEAYTCALTTVGEAYCWGNDSEGQLGNGTTGGTNTPVAVSTALTFSSISAGQSHACALTTSGAAHCWGSNGSGELGDTSTTERTSPVAVADGHSFQSISAGQEHTCGATTDNDAYCWGYGGQGQIGDGNWSGANTSPVAVIGGHSFETIDIGRMRSCAITTTNDAYCWGADEDGALGNGATGSVLEPGLVSNGYKWLAVVTGEGSTSCGVSGGGGVYCWGSNSSGQLGNNSTVNHDVPRPTHFFVATGDTVVALSVDATLTFTVSGRSGLCNGVAQSEDASSNGVAVNLGRINTVNGIGAQDIVVSTNAAGGFTVFMRSGTQMQSAGGHALAGFGGTNALPVDFPLSGTEAAGYTTDDAGLGSGTPSRFVDGGAKWADLASANAEVSHGDGSVSNDIVCVAYQAGAGATTPAGSYSTNVVYTAVPVF